MPVMLRNVGLFGLAMSLGAIPRLASADSWPASVHLCAQEADPGRRLACYDHEAARLSEPATPATPASQPSAPVDARKSAAQVASQPKDSAAPVKDAGAHAKDASPQVAEGTPPKEPRRVTARVVSVQNNQGDLVVHLDNGQVWEQVQEAAADLNLKAGDTVTIDKGLLGAYWLSGRSDAVVKVQLRK